MIFHLPKIDPIAIGLGPIVIRWYSLAYIAGMIYVLWWLKSQNKKERFLSDEAYESWLTWAVLSVIVGGRLGYVLFYGFSYFLHHPLEIFAVWHGGMSFHGGLIGAIFGMWLFAKKYKIDFFTLTDHLAVATPVGLFFGRIANFVNMELYGRATEGSFGIIFPDAGDFPRHPSQLYEALLEGLLLFLLMNWLFFRTNFRSSLSVVSGRLSGVFLLGYGLARALVENYREPDQQIGYFFGSITMGQILCLPLIFCGVYLMFFRKVKNISKIIKIHKKQRKISKI